VTVFAAMFETLFANADMAVDAVWRRAGTGAPVAVRLVAARPDEVFDLGGTRLRRNLSKFQIRQSELADPLEGDTFEIGADLYRVQGQPVADRDRLIWSLECVKV
jgi:hypothetical protein